MKLIKLLSITVFVSQFLLAQETIRMIRVHDQPILCGSLNGKKAYFLIDTGSDISMLNSKDAKKFKFDYAPVQLKHYRLSGLSSVHHQDFLISKDANLFLGNTKLESCFIVFDLTNIAESILNDTGIKINGIIGSDLMKSISF